jgi:hypothetical protein
MISNVYPDKITATKVKDDMYSILCEYEGTDICISIPMAKLQVDHLICPNSEEVLFAINVPEEIKD